MWSLPVFLIVPQAIPPAPDPWLEWAKLFVGPAMVLLGVWVGHGLSKRREADARLAAMVEKRSFERKAHLTTVKIRVTQATAAFPSLRRALNRYSNTAGIKRSKSEAEQIRLLYCDERNRFDKLSLEAAEAAESYGMLPDGAAASLVRLTAVISNWRNWMERQHRSGENGKDLDKMAKEKSDRLLASCEILQNHEEECTLAAAKKPRARVPTCAKTELDALNSEFALPENNPKSKS